MNGLAENVDKFFNYLYECLRKPLHDSVSLDYSEFSDFMKIEIISFLTSQAELEFDVLINDFTIMQKLLI